MSISSLENIQFRLPNFYDKYNNRSVIHGLINVFADIGESRTDTINRLDDMIGIDTTRDEDLQYRWGNMLSINKNPDESYTAYRNRLKMAYPSLVGGTEKAIKYAIASTIGISNEQDLIDTYINVYDAWEYDGPINIDESIKGYGNVLCTIDLTVGQNAFDMENEIIDAINIVKASGVKPHILYLNLKVDTYSQLNRFTYKTVNNILYDKLGKEVQYGT